MDRLQAMRVFTRIVELGGFGRAADDLDIPKASVTQAIQQLEAYLGVQLLQRTTRQVSVTPDGEAYYRRCRQWLAELDEIEASFASARTSPKGTLRVNVPASLGRLVIIPALPEFCERYPELSLEIGLGDRQVHLLREGVDCALRAGDVTDLGLVARPVALLRQVTCASRDYLERHGIPESLEDLMSYQAVNYQSATTGRTFNLEFKVDGHVRQIALPSRVTVNNADAYVAACEAGLGVIQAPRYHLTKKLDSGLLIEVLSAWRPPALPLSIVCPAQRYMPHRVRVFIDWLVELLAKPQWQNCLQPTSL
ncbi:DNA-binding transcriptional LysR family regulator [Pseudomonas duriflava]|uniref:DNA-binding transcriptional LysR family regulator n=1 Tax=Pseudomonas duriflava TaxID=459528 RepID=A0A562Q7M5_9PSED|nr:LysR family transcriptional regulator [Pseudomonas duriflava]TWI52762.1 DNA-binding transcriptional LysR family regulator [Pseudomonas duriflava]